MKNFRPIRIAVTLSLIVTMMIQPVVSPALASACGASTVKGGCCQNQAKSICDGCGCCEVKKPGDHCGCCRGTEEPKSELSDCGHPSPASDSDTAVDSPAVVKGVCLCTVSNPPMNRGSEREQAREQLQLRSAIVAVISFDEWGLKRSAPPLFPDAASGANSRFTQLFLCVWRI